MLLSSTPLRRAPLAIALSICGVLGWCLIGQYILTPQPLPFAWPGKGSEQSVIESGQVVIESQQSVFGSAQGLIANATLGFGAIVAISAENRTDPLAWRRKGMIAAANRTGLQIEITSPPPVNETELDILMTAGKGPYPRPGSGLALYAQFALLERFLASGMETILVLEDDSDWELAIRHLLAPSGAIADAVRESTMSSADVATHPYGDKWDLLWLGHCGFESIKPEGKMAFADNDTMPTERLKGVVRPQNYRDMKNHTREVHPRVAAMCTFGIGVTRPWAEQVLALRHKGGTKGYDYTTNAHCKGGMRCVGVLPELFHHQRALGGGIVGTIEKLNAGAGPDPERESQKLEEDPDSPPHYFTLNLKHSARCNAHLQEPTRAMCPPSQKEWEVYNS